MTPTESEELSGLPGAELVLVGLADLEAGRLTTEALLVEIAAPRLRRLGLAVPPRDDPEPERTLYLKLFAEQPVGVHGRYNALIRRLISFSQALEGRVARARRRPREGPDSLAHADPSPADPAARKQAGRSAGRS